jgi:ribosomal protein S18 acetylase RimI-like enzyme
MARIVPMTADRFDAMNQIDVEAWSDWATKKFGHTMVFPTKQPVYGTYLDGDPDGSFIAVDERDSPVGYIFTRTHGAVGFFGPFGVVPRAQASHVGKALVEATIRYMERCGCTTIGLETMPETAYNLGLYSKLGFRLFTMTLRLHKELGPGPSELPANVEMVTKPSSALLERVREISGTLEEGLDQSKEVGLLRQYPVGAVLTYEGTGGVQGFALCYAFPDTVGLYPPSDAQNVRIRMLGMDAGQCGQADLERFIGACEAYTRSLDRTTVTLPLYAEYFASLGTLFHLGYRVHDGFPSLVKLAQRNYHVPHPGAVSLYEWAG